ncbi:Hypothetical protein PHPALM_12145 [Phytophthora palmivora]|uniref:Uncharacterized protein n=1 Tax=Phytophthora palmivora TaxID=4796 RepID=A0A2P4Y0G9_9STRA|nr:Hypothetical protein PHPALM_12145 [Phytophthora palmivora]
MLMNFSHQFFRSPTPIEAFSSNIPSVAELIYGLEVNIVLPALDVDGNASDDLTSSPRLSSELLLELLSASDSELELPLDGALGFEFRVCFGLPLLQVLRGGGLRALAFDLRGLLDCTLDSGHDARRVQIRSGRWKSTLVQTSLRVPGSALGIPCFPFDLIQLALNALCPNADAADDDEPFLDTYDTADPDVTSRDDTSEVPTKLGTGSEVVPLDASSRVDVPDDGNCDGIDATKCDVPAQEGRDSNVDNNDNNTSSLGKDAKVDNSDAAGATPRDIQESSKQPSHDRAYVQDGYGGTEAMMVFDGLTNQDLDDLGRMLGNHVEKYREQEAAADRTEMETIKANLESDFGSMAEERAALESRLNDRIQKLEGQLEDANRAISRLKQENRSALDADRLMTFLNDHGNNIRGRWPRLRHLLRHFQKRTTPPASWRTWVTVEAVDKPFRMVPPYPGPLRSDSEASGDEGAPSGDNFEQEEKSEDRPPPAENSLSTDAKGTPSKSESKFPSKSQSPSKQPAKGPVKQSHPTSQLMRLTSMKSQDGDIEVQSRPSTHPESDKRALPHDGHLKHSTKSIAGRLPDFVAWSDLRKDVLLTMQMSFRYALSVEMMGEDKMAHHRFPETSLVEKLIQMMYQRCLDETKWTKYVPEYYYT